ncbi:MAG: hypothetical protein KAI39_07885 [Desulfobulbaceae bacterium]|nr:hypothetical protein [Desulfobulbaceae bacterium]
MQELAITQENTKISVHEIEHTDSELYKVGMYGTAAFAAVIGIWGTICLASALMQGGGPIQLVRQLFQAVTGM